jgi:hypothetical protein
MTQIRCSQRLWRRLGNLKATLASQVVYDAILGSWAAALFRVEDKSLVVALNERTYLTLVFPFTSEAGFMASFSVALGEVLTDMSISAGRTQAERAAIQTASVAHLVDSDMRAALADLEFFLGIELLYHDNLRRVQLNLNELPHANRVPHVPREAVEQLFGRG